METTQQLEEKLKEKVDLDLSNQIDLNPEQDTFHKYVNSHIQIIRTCLFSVYSPLKFSFDNNDEENNLQS